MVAIILKVAALAGLSSRPVVAVKDSLGSYQSARGVKAQALSDLHALCMLLLQPITLCSPAQPLAEALAMEARTAVSPNMAKTIAPRRVSNKINHGSGRDSVIGCVRSRPVVSYIVFLESTRIPTERLLWNHVVVLSFLKRQLRMWD